MQQQKERQINHQQGDGKQEEAEQWEKKETSSEEEQPQRGFDDTNEGTRGVDAVEGEGVEQNPAIMPQSETQAEGHMGRR